jgi:hypothetical protein
MVFLRTVKWGRREHWQAGAIIDKRGGGLKGASPTLTCSRSGVIMPSYCGTCRSVGGGMDYHVLNRGNGRMWIFRKAEGISIEGVSRAFPSPRTIPFSRCP